MRTILAVALVTLMGTGPAAAWPGMFLFVGYMKDTSAKTCQDIMADACSSALGSCVRRQAGQTLAVNYTSGVYNFSLQCTYFRGIDAVMYGVAGSAETGKDQDLLPKVKTIKDYIDRKLR